MCSGAICAKTKLTLNRIESFGTCAAVPCCTVSVYRCPPHRHCEWHRERGRLMTGLVRRQGRMLCFRGGSDTWRTRVRREASQETGQPHRTTPMNRSFDPCFNTDGGLSLFGRVKCGERTRCALDNVFFFYSSSPSLLMSMQRLTLSSLHCVEPVKQLTA